jgi:2-dehydropantoate 2-reductase
MRSLERMLEQYNQDHTHPINRATHLVGIPALALSLPALLLWPAGGLALLLVGAALQLVGHAFEGKPPSFVRDPRFVLVGAAWYAWRILGRKRQDLPVSRRYVVVGAGAVGSHVGGMLARAGHSVVMLVREGQAQHIARDGLVLEGLGGSHRVAVRAVTTPTAVAAADAVLLCVKSQDTAEVARAIGLFLPAHVPVVSLQNGVRNAALLEEHLGAGRVVAGVVTFNAVSSSAGRSLLALRGGLVLAESAAAGPLVRELCAAGVPTSTTDRIEGALWSKLLVNLGNGLCALTGQTTRQALADPVFCRLAARVLAEGLAVLDEAGVTPAPLGGVDARWLLWALQLPLPALVRRLLSRLVHPEARGSTAQSLARGSGTEIEFLSGEIARLAEVCGARAPLNSAVRDWILARQARPVPAWSSADLARRLEDAAAGRVQPDHEVVVIGAGLAGLGAGLRLLQAGMRDLVLLERNDFVGGTWKVNTYPGVAVDTNSFNYSYAFVPYAEWTRAYAPGVELAAYADHLAEHQGLREHILFRTEVQAASFDERTHLWNLSLASGQTLTCRFLVHAPGGLTQPKYPEIEGLQDFRGSVMHTAQWDWQVPLAGKRVAVIGTGASAVQVVPSVAPTVEKLTVFQRTPIWVFPKPDFVIPPWMRALLQASPLAARVVRALSAIPSTVLFRIGTLHHRRIPSIRRLSERIMLRHLEAQVADPVLRARLTPGYGFGCKRPVVSNDYLRTFERDNVELVTDRIERITAEGIVCADGSLHEVDVIVLATGFFVFTRGHTPPYPVVGLGGVEVGDFWHEHRYQAYEACTLPRWPNMFLLTAPYGLGGASYLTMVDAAVTHALRVIRTAHRRGATFAAVRQEAHDTYFASIQRRQQATVFYSGACTGSNSYYFDRHGDAVAVRPHLGFEIWLHSRWSSLRHYTFRALT